VQEGVELRRCQLEVVEERVEGARLRAEVLGEEVGMQARSEPAQAEQTVGAGRLVDPAEGPAGRDMDLAVADGLEVAPARVGGEPVAERGIEARIASGFQAATCSGDTGITPPGAASPATLTAPAIAMSSPTVVPDATVFRPSPSRA
jgi:hypothetical protein